MISVIAASAHRDGLPPPWVSLIAKDPGISVVASPGTADLCMKVVREHASKGNAVVVVCAATLEQDGLLRVINECRALGTRVVAVLSPTDVELLHRAVIAGVAAFRFQPGPIEPLVADIRAVSASRPSVAWTASTARTAGRVVVVASAAGGSGKTLVATSLAWLLAKDAGPDQVALVDLDLQFGNVDIVLGVTPERSIGNILAAAADLTREDLLRVTVATRPGARLLASPRQLEQAAAVQGDHISGLLGACSKAFDLTVVDTAKFVDDALAAALRGADLLLLVVTPQFVCVRNTLKLTETLRRLGVSRERVSVVLNGWRSDGHASAAQKEIGRELQKFLPDAVIATVPFVANPWTAWLDRGGRQQGPIEGPLHGPMAQLTRAVALRAGVDLAKNRPGSAAVAGTRRANGRTSLFSRLWSRRAS